MRLSTLFKRTLQDMFDPSLVVISFIFIGGLSVILSPFLSEVLGTLAFEYLVTNNPADALAAAFSSLSDPLVLLSYIIYLLLMAYLASVVVAMIGKKRGEDVPNPFVLGKSRMLAYLATVIGIFAPVFFIFALYFPFARTVLGTKLFIPIILLASIYFLFVAPTIPAVILGERKARTNFQKGILVGKRHWWRLLLVLIGISIVLYILNVVFGLIALINVPYLSDLLLYLFQAISFLSTLAAITELYLLDLHGE